MRVHEENGREQGGGGGDKRGVEGGDRVRYREGETIV